VGKKVFFDAGNHDAGHQNRELNFEVAMARI
jgi:hypothetical protein